MCKQGKGIIPDRGNSVFKGQAGMTSSLCCRSLFILYTVYVSLLHCIRLTLPLGIFSHPQTEGLDSNLSFVKVIKEGRSSTRCVALSLGF